MDLVLNQIDEMLDRVIAKDSSPRRDLYEGARYLLFGPSKRMRPLFVVATASLFEVPLDHILPAACAIELIHTYSLIHDDLPCMDDDDYRRGKLALHKVYDEATALLIGDYLLTYAFEVLVDAPHLSAEKKVALIKSLSKHSGSEGMIGGQLMDLRASPMKLDDGSLREIHKRKTAALFVASFEFGGILACAPPTIMSTLSLLGETVGLLFQLVDDIQDGDYPKEFSEGEGQAKALFEKALSLLEDIPKDTLHVRALIEKIFAGLQARIGVNSTQAQ